MSFDTKADVVSPMEIRPRFRLLTKLNVKDAIQHMKEDVEVSDQVEGRFIMEQVDLQVAQIERHYWSPVLHINFENDDEFENTLVRCLIGPNQAVWTLFLLGYIVVGILVLFGGMYGMVQFQLGTDAPFLWSFPIAGLLFAILYFGAKFGQKKGHDQMIYLIKFLYKSLEREEITHL